MARYVPHLAKIINSYDKEKCQELIIKDIPFQKMQLPTKCLLEEYAKLKVLRVVNCDLRTLENFPKLPSLTHLYISDNKLQGTFHLLASLKNLKYLDLSNNIVSSSRNLAALQRLKGLTVVVVGNLFVAKEDDWKDTICALDLKVEDELDEEYSLVSSWKRVKEQAESDQRKIKILKRREMEEREKVERERLRESQRTLQQFLDMVQKSQSSMDNDIIWPRRDQPSRQLSRRVFDSGLGEEDINLDGARSFIANIQARLSSPRQFDDMGPYYNHQIESMESDYGMVADRFDMGSDQY